MALRNIAAAAVLAAAASGLGAQAQAQAAPDTVRVAQGLVHGQVTHLIAAFKAIPFAAPPVGDLRWRPPEPARPWTGVRDATAAGPACMQMSRQPNPNLKQSEDCLTLNVWTPLARPAGAKLPVMVWMHGGSFTGGTGSSPFYDGANFAARGVVLVTVNYRLGKLGFFAHPALTAEQPRGPLGNYGMMDNLAALQWVQANIAAFGGDPKNVTAFGESAGGILINDLMASPKARGLFAKAISESGFGRLVGPPIRGDAPTAAEKAGVAYAASLGVSGTGPEALKALRALPAEKLSIATLAGGAPTPIIDGVILPESPAQAFAKGHELKVPYIAGGNSWEASLFPQSKDLPDATLARTGPLRDKVVAAYGGPADLAGVSQDYTTESTVIEPDRNLARLHVKNGQKAWVYYFSYVTAAQRAAVRGMGHGGELLYVFNNLPLRPLTIGTRTIPAGTPEDRRISDAATAYWVAFAKASDPDSAGGPAWPRYNLANDPVIEFGIDGVHVRPDFHKANLDVVEQVAAAAH